MSIELVMPSSHLILCHPLRLLPPLPPSIRVFSNESALHKVAQVLEFQLQYQYIILNAGLDEAQAGIKIARRNINDLRYADDITLWQKAKN